MVKKNKEPYVSDTSDFIVTPEEEQDKAPTDMLSEFVEKTMDNIKDTFDGKPDNGDK